MIYCHTFKKCNISPTQRIKLLSAQKLQCIIKSPLMKKDHHSGLKLASHRNPQGDIFMEANADAEARIIPAKQPQEHTAGRKIHSSDDAESVR